MKDIIANLVTLQEIQFSGKKLPQPEIDALRKSVPDPVLGHYDRLVARGKKGVAPVQNGICKGCQIQIPIGLVNSLIVGASISTCGNCGRYLCLLPEEAISLQDKNKSEAMRVAKVAVPTLRQKSIRPSRKSSARLGNVDVPVGPER